MRQEKFCLKEPQGEAIASRNALLVTTYEYNMKVLSTIETKLTEIARMSHKTKYN